MSFIANAFPVLTHSLSLNYEKTKTKKQKTSNLLGYPSLQAVLRLVSTSDGIGVVVGVVRALPTGWKLKIRVMSGVISSTAGRIRTASFSSDCALDADAYDQWKTSLKAETEDQTSWISTWLH